MVNFQFETEMFLFESGWVCSGICTESVSFGNLQVTEEAKETINTIWSSSKFRCIKENIKETMLKILLEPEEKKRIKKLGELQEEMERYVLPIRELPGKERRKNISNKYKNNQKSSF